LTDVLVAVTLMGSNVLAFSATGVVDAVIRAPEIAIHSTTANDASSGILSSRFDGILQDLCALFEIEFEMMPGRTFVTAQTERLPYTGWRTWPVSSTAL